MEIVQRGSRIYFQITSVTNYFAQHAETVAPPPPLSYLFWERALLSHMPHGAPGNLCALLNGNFYCCPRLEWQLAVADWGKPQAGFVCRALGKVNGLLNRHCAPNSLINAISGPCLCRR